MASKRTAARSQPQPKQKNGLTKTEACKLLQIAPAADEELITQAYWHQARKVRAYARTDPAARTRLDELNRAYRVLNPSRGEAPLESETPASEDSVFAEAMTGWLRRIIDQTAARWPGRATEVAVLSATTALLTFLALGAGANPLWTVLAAGAAGLTIWAPWRRTQPPARPGPTRKNS